MGVWSLFHIASPLNTTSGTGLVGELTKSSGRSLKFSQVGPDELTFSMPGNHEQTARIDTLIDDILVFRDDAPVQRFRVTGRSLTKEGGVLSAEFTCLSYRALLDAWIFHDTTVVATERRSWPAALTTTQRKVSEIMWQIVDQGQNRPSGDLGISKFTAAPAGDVTLPDLVGETGGDFFLPGSKKGEALDTMASMAPGFRWGIAPDPAAPYTDLKMTLTQFDVGATSSLLLDDGGTVASWSHNLAGADYGNVLRIGVEGFTGNYYPSETGPTTPLEGRWERSEDGSPPEELTLQADADAYVAKYAPGIYTAMHDLTAEITCTLRRGRWDGPAQLWVGSQARFLVSEKVTQGKTTDDDEYILSIDELIEVTEINVTVDDVGAEDVSLSLGRPRYNASSDLRELDRRIAALERL